MSTLPFGYLIPIFLIVLYFILRKKKPAVEPLTVTDKQILEDYVSFYHKLSTENKTRFEQKIASFFSNVKIEAVGLEMTTLDELLIASSAVIPIFGFDDWTYKNLSTVLLYPDTFNKDFQFEQGSERNVMGMVGTGYMNGQMILSRSALRHGFSKSAGKENTAIHEFVHLLDKSDGATDGIPENLLSHQYTLPWVKMMHEEIERIKDDKSDINPYAMTNQAEFFAVVSEYFFERPDLLKEKHPDLYQMLSRAFAQNPIK
ncbi:zinc-dependent peptidase [Pedobacter changchengzhani]|uniref:Zinc-dependent peptidase n=1 Tax=Pedobacter changchengzhani TaxID=2529274 RepID=A0A4R5MPU1_9SPHI|nr:M90 family metallopeptidase [Pedobacter changchengzhani]TDG37656.1 zinc-dependent peptidase [Pedobacter changchengzhani]